MKDGAASSGMDSKGSHSPQPGTVDRQLLQTYARSFGLQQRVKYPLLDGLEAGDLRTVLAASRQMRCQAGSVISSQGEPADRVFLLVRGRARFFMLTPEGEKVILMWLPEGHAFGGGTFSPDPSFYLVSTEAVRDSLVLAWEKSTFLSLARQFPIILENCLFGAFQYLSFYVATHLALITNNAMQRLAEVLYHLALGIGHESAGGIEVDVTNEELSQAANVTPFTTSRQLNRWRREGILTKRRGKIVLLKPHRLFGLEAPSKYMLNPAYWWLTQIPATSEPQNRSKAS
jgi:CRP-like cAMP-binding protein